VDRAIGYIRVSTEDQALEGVSLAAQRKKIEAWSDLNDHELVTIEEDAGISGATTGKRPGLRAAVDQACRRKGTLVVYSLSRLARSTMDALLIAERLEKAGADLVSLSEKIDTTTAAGKMVFRMLAVLAEFERDQLAERTRSAMQHLRSQQKRISRHIPFGWDLASCGELLVLNEEEQEGIELMIELRRVGLSYRAIAVELEVLGISTKQGKANWSPKVIRDLVNRQESAA
jgi:DNA invertase Pin-like site-specific DNA recombinase